jgi:predicted metal-dependent phosphoesterase TrpH
MWRAESGASVKDGVHVDFHFHTALGSPGDGGMSSGQIIDMLAYGPLDVVYITDHDQIHGAYRELAQHYPGIINLGEEITTIYRGKKVEFIGLNLERRIEPGKDPFRTGQEIHDQGGLLYVPHPGEEGRKGSNEDLMDELHRQVGIDIVEYRNGRSRAREPGRRAADWAARNMVVTAVGSDAHGPKGWGRTYTVLEDYPTPENTTELLRHRQPSKDATRSVGAAGYLHPFGNRVGKKFGIKIVQAANMQCSET